MPASLPRPPINENYSSTLSSGITDSATTVTIGDASGLVAPCYLVIDRVDSSGTLKNSSLWEYIKVTSISSNDLTVTRGQGGSTNQAHSSGAVIEAIVTSSHFEDWYNVLNPEHTTVGGHVISTATVDYGEFKRMAVTSIASIAVISTNSLTLPNLAVTSLASIAQGHITSIHGANASITATGNFKTLALNSIASAAVPEFGIQNVNGHLLIKPGTGKQILIQGSRRNIGSASYESPVSEQYGWTFITGDGANSRISTTVTFNTPYAAAPVVIPAFLGLRAGSDPTAISDINATTDDQIGARAYNITASQFTLELKSSTNLAADTRYGVSWRAAGQM